MKHLFTIILYLTIAFTAISQESNEWQYLRPTNTGLPGDFVYTVTSDRCGNIWSTAYQYFWDDGGVTEFDGTYWKSWSNFEGYIPDDRVHDIEFDIENHVWIATENGLARYDRHGSWTTFQKNTIGNTQDHYVSLATDKNSHYIWAVYTSVQTIDGGIVKFDGNTWTTYNTSNSNLPTTQITDIEVDLQGNVWLGSPMGAIKFDGLNWIIYDQQNSPISSSAVVDIEIADNGDIWFLTPTGINIYDGTNWTLDIGMFNAINQGADLTSLAIHNGRIGIGVIGFGTSGAAYYNGSSWSAHPFTDHVYDVHIDGQNRLWVAGRGFLSKYENNSWTDYTNKSTGLNSYFLEDIFIDSKNRKWFAGTGHSVMIDSLWRNFSNYNKGSEPFPFWYSSVAYATVEDKQGHIWIGIDGTYGGIARWNDAVDSFDIVFEIANAGVPLQGVQYMTVDTFGNIWVGTYMAGVMMYNGSAWNHFDKNNSSLPTDFIQGLSADKKGNIWASTTIGVVKFSNSGNNDTLFTKTNSGLPDDMVYEVEEDLLGNLWFATFKGITKYDGTNWTTYTETDGIAADKVTSIAIDNNNKIYIAANNVYTWPYYGGISIFDGNQWTTFTDANSPLAHKQVEDVELDHHDNLWVLTQSEGVTIYKKDGLVNFQDPESYCATGIIATGIDNAKMTSYIDIFPNPATATVYLQINSAEEEIAEVTIFDMAGRTVHYNKIQLSAGNNFIENNIAEYTPGIYFIKVSNVGKDQVLKFIKVKE